VLVEQVMGISLQLPPTQTPFVKQVWLLEHGSPPGECCSMHSEPFVVSRQIIRWQESGLKPQSRSVLATQLPDALQMEAVEQNSPSSQLALTKAFFTQTAEPLTATQL
jgi:hypothetical protein